MLRTAIGDPTGRFRDGQWEAIDALVNRRKKLMVVQRTGWGKSSGYFINTRILRDSGAGPTVIVSPLLALMRNQIRLGIRAATEEHRKAMERKRRAECDVPRVAVGAGRFVGVRRVSAGGDEMQGHATRRQVIVEVLAPRGVRAGTDTGRTWAAEGHGRRLIFCTRNRTDPISGFAKNGDVPGGTGIAATVLAERC